MDSASQLAAAVSSGDVFLVRLCLASFPAGASAAGLLASAATNCDASTVEALLEFGADPLQRDRRGATVAHVAAARDAHDVLCVVLDACDDLVESCDDRGDFPLHVAARRGSLRCVEALLHCAADPLALNRETKRTPRDVAYKRGFKPIAKLLDEYARLGAVPGHSAARRSTLRSLKGSPLRGLNGSPLRASNDGSARLGLPADAASNDAAQKADPPPRRAEPTLAAPVQRPTALTIPPWDDAAARNGRRAPLRTIQPNASGEGLSRQSEAFAGKGASEALAEDGRQGPQASEGPPFSSQPQQQPQQRPQPPPPLPRVCDAPRGGASIAAARHGAPRPVVSPDEPPRGSPTPVAAVAVSGWGATPCTPPASPASPTMWQTAKVEASPLRCSEKAPACATPPTSPPPQWRKSTPSRTATAHKARHDAVCYYATPISCDGAAAVACACLSRDFERAGSGSNAPEADEERVPKWRRAVAVLAAVFAVAASTSAGQRRPPSAAMRSAQTAVAVSAPGVRRSLFHDAIVAKRHRSALHKLEAGIVAAWRASNATASPRRAAAADDRHLHARPRTLAPVVWRRDARALRSLERRLLAAWHRSNATMVLDTIFDEQRPAAPPATALPPMAAPPAAGVFVARPLALQRPLALHRPWAAALRHGIAGAVLGHVVLGHVVPLLLARAFPPLVPARLLLSPLAATARRLVRFVARVCRLALGR
ncbi:hypothetical protein M885DRAFT_617384 [Pelagophyceae sp. CCMP2097]|nr:hypothetical protein M885DRAFT_617384 [Pelagophyceae sp. CCMP2097]